MIDCRFVKDGDRYIGKRGKFGCHQLKKFLYKYANINFLEGKRGESHDLKVKFYFICEKHFNQRYDVTADLFGHKVDNSIKQKIKKKHKYWDYDDDFKKEVEFLIYKGLYEPGNSSNEIS